MNRLATFTLTALFCCTLLVSVLAMNATPAALPNTGAETPLVSQEEVPMKETSCPDDTSDKIVYENDNTETSQDAYQGDIVESSVKNGKVFVEDYGYLKYIDADYESVLYMQYVKNAHTIVEYKASVVYVSDDGREVQFNVEGLTLFNFMCVEATGYKVGDIVPAYALFSFDE